MIIKHLRFLLLISILTVSLTLLSQPGTLDVSFGSGGKVATNFGPNDYGQVNSIAIQPDKKIIAAGYDYSSVTSRYYIKVVRYDTNGVIDNSFGTAGQATFAVGGGNDDEAYAVTVQSDGKIVVAGFSLRSVDYDITLLRLKTNGTLDSSFGTNGVVLKDLGSDDYANNVAIQPDGKIVICGSTSNGTDQEFAVVRFNSNGTIDSGFGTGGTKVVAMMTNSEDIPTTLKIQGDGKILIGGFSVSTTTFITRGSLLRLNTDGSIDTNFGSSGKVMVSLNPGGDVIFSLAIQSDGKIIAAGQSEKGNSQVLLMRYKTDGVIDSTFGTNGIVNSTFNPSNPTQSSCVALQADGKILVGGAVDSTDSDFALFRFNSNGGTDTTFGTKGKVATDFNSGYDYASSIIIQPNGRIVLGGTTDEDFALARYLSDGAATLDAGITGMAVPANSCGAHGNNQTVSVTVTNNGSSAIASGAVTVTLAVTGANSGSFNATNSPAIGSGSNTTLSFNAVNLSNIGTNLFSATLTFTGDGNASNNTQSARDTSFPARPTVSFTSTNTGKTYNFTSSVTAKSPFVYVWDFGDGSATSGLPNPSHTYASSNTYTVRLTVVDACGQDSAKQVITILGVKDPVKTYAFTVYPNPANNEIRVKSSINENGNIFVSDALGRMVYAGAFIAGDEVRIDTSSLPNGIYVIRLNGISQTICIRHNN
jgi:uncharacterized delta-60 repeat protein